MILPPSSDAEKKKLKNTLLQENPLESTLELKY